MSLYNLLPYLGTHHLTIAEDIGIVAVMAVSVFAVLWCLNDQRERVAAKGK